MGLNEVNMGLNEVILALFSTVWHCLVHCSCPWTLIRHSYPISQLWGPVIWDPGYRTYGTLDTGIWDPEYRNIPWVGPWQYRHG